SQRRDGGLRTGRNNSQQQPADGLALFLPAEPRDGALLWVWEQHDGDRSVPVPRPSPRERRVFRKAQLSLQDLGRRGQGSGVGETYSSDRRQRSLSYSAITILNAPNPGPRPLAPDLFTVRVPASTSNLGAGFDCIGMALDLWLEARIVPG